MEPLPRVSSWTCRGVVWWLVTGRTPARRRRRPESCSDHYRGRGRWFLRWKSFLLTMGRGRTRVDAFTLIRGPGRSPDAMVSLGSRIKKASKSLEKKPQNRVLIGSKDRWEDELNRQIASPERWLQVAEKAPKLGRGSPRRENLPQREEKRFF